MNESRCMERLAAYLRQEGVPFHTQHHPEAYTAREVAVSEHLSGDAVAKVVVVFADGKPALLVLPASARVDTEEAGAALGARVARLATEEELAQLFPDCEVGTMPPFGNLYDLPVNVDESLSTNPQLVFQAGTHADTMSVRYGDFERLVRPHVARFAHRQLGLSGRTSES
jgi:Ala-tRNA(Pro) deacylase